MDYHFKINEEINEGASMKRKLILFDVDNTLIDHSKTQSEIPKETVTAVKKLHEQGHVIGLATGRSYAHMKDVMNMLEMTCCVCYGGHVVLVDGEEIYKEYLDVKQVNQLVKSTYCSIYPAMAIDEQHIYIKDLIGKVKKVLYQEFNTIEGESFIGDLTPVKRLGIKPRKYLSMMIFRKKIKNPEKYTKLDFNAWGDKGFEVYAKGVSKYSGIQRLAKHLKIHEDGIYVFGDSYNDLHMLTHVKNSVAVGNGVDEAKEVASYVSPPIDQGGILTACYELGLLEGANE